MFINDNARLASLVIANIAAPASIGTAAATVDIASSFAINQTAGTAAAPIVVTIPAPTVVTPGLMCRLMNTGTGFFLVAGSVVAPDTYKDFAWDGNSWNPESERGSVKPFKQVIALVAGNNVITHNLGLAAPFISLVDVRDTVTGERVEVRVVPASQATNSLTINIPVAYATAAVTIYG